MKHMDKKKVNEKQLSPSDSERHFGVVLENIDSKLDLVVEGHQALDRKIDNKHTEFKEFEKVVNYKFEVLIEGVKTLDKKVDRHYGEFQEFRQEVDYKFEIVFDKFDDVTDELRIIRNELKEKVSRDEFILLEKRVLSLEKSRK